MSSESLADAPKMSTLCRTVMKDGWELAIHIYEDGEGKWLLQIENDSGTFTCWTEPFETEQFALDEALNAIEHNGLEFFHESQPWREH